jgi:hypothetical protein
MDKNMSEMFSDKDNKDFKILDENSNKDSQSIKLNRIESFKNKVNFKPKGA